MGLLDTLVGDYPGAFLLAILAAQGLLVWLWRSLRWFVKREFERMERHQKRQDQAIESIQGRLNQYDITFAVSRTAFDDLVATIEKHVQKEDKLPIAVAQIATDVAWIKGEIKRQNGGSK
jgi:hypothetical protein